MIQWTNEEKGISKSFKNCALNLETTFVWNVLYVLNQCFPNFLKDTFLCYSAPYLIVSEKWLKQKFVKLLKIIQNFCWHFLFLK